MKVFYVLLCLIFLNNINLVFSAPALETVKKTLNVGWKNMPESERANHHKTQEAHLNDRVQRATSAATNVYRARLFGNEVQAKKHITTALQRKASTKRIENNLTLLDSNKPLRMKESTSKSGNLPRTDFKPKRIH